MVQLQTRGMIQEGRGDIQGDVKDASEVLSCTLKCRRVNSHGGCGPLATGRHSPGCSLPGQHHPGGQSMACWGQIQEMSDVKLHSMGRQRKGL